MNTNSPNPAGKLQKGIVVSLLPCLLVLGMQGVLANSVDTSSIQISANSIKLEPAKRRVLYSGKVRLQHKSLAITGTKAVAKSQNAGRGKVTITGSPVVAKFVDSQGKPVRLTSESLAYDATTRTLLATGNVELQSDQGLLNGQKMQYDMADDRFRIEGDPAAPRISAILKVREKSVQ